MKFVHLPDFDKVAADLFHEEDVVALREWLSRNPTCGDVIQGSGGCRKLRWAAKGHGKRGGARVIYFYRLSASTILLIKTYAKNEKSDLSSAEIKTLKKTLKIFLK